MKQFPAAKSSQPIPDDVQEMKVLTHTDSAQFGGGLGGTINVVTKSGTNRFHGGAWEFWRGSRVASMPRATRVESCRTCIKTSLARLSAARCCCPTTTARIARFSMEAMKGSGKTIGSVQQQLVPTAAQLSGDFSGLLAYKGIQLYNPFTANRDLPQTIKFPPT